MLPQRIRINLRILTTLGTLPRGPFHTTEKLAEKADCSLLVTRKRVTELANEEILITKGGHHGGVQFKQKPSNIPVYPLIKSMGGFQHDVIGPECCVPQWANECFVEDWIEDIKNNVLDDVYVEDLVRYLINDKETKNGNG